MCQFGVVGSSRDWVALKSESLRRETRVANALENLEYLLTSSDPLSLAEGSASFFQRHMQSTGLSSDCLYIPVTPQCSNLSLSQSLPHSPSSQFFLLLLSHSSDFTTVSFLLPSLKPVAPVFKSSLYFHMFCEHTLVHVPTNAHTCIYKMKSQFCMQNNTCDGFLLNRGYFTQLNDLWCIISIPLFCATLVLRGNDQLSNHLREGTSKGPK